MSPFSSPCAAASIWDSGSSRRLPLGTQRATRAGAGGGEEWCASPCTCGASSEAYEPSPIGIPLSILSPAVFPFDTGVSNNGGHKLNAEADSKESGSAQKKCIRFGPVLSQTAQLDSGDLGKLLDPMRVQGRGAPKKRLQAKTMNPRHKSKCGYCGERGHKQAYMLQVERAIAGWVRLKRRKNLMM